MERQGGLGILERGKAGVVATVGIVKGSQYYVLGRDSISDKGCSRDLLSLA